MLALSGLRGFGMTPGERYPIGIPGQKWGDPEKTAWLESQVLQRSYEQDVLARLQPLRERFDVVEYGRLANYPGTGTGKDYPLLAAKSRKWRDGRPVALVTGGVHGYETSGVLGALRFLETSAEVYSNDFNVLVAPCVSPWGYETINRWNPAAIDPNRAFTSNSPAPESAALMQLLATTPGPMEVHIDLHETTDSDNDEFRPALAARDAVEQDNWNIPDGFYLVGDTEVPAHAFQAAIIARVQQVTHIAPADDQGKLIGVSLTQPGVINYATGSLGLCAGVTSAAYRTTTEVYPDSPRVDGENCILAQLAAIEGGLDYVIASR